MAPDLQTNGSRTSMPRNYGILTEAVMENFETYFIFVFHGTVSLVGVTTNTLNVLVFWQLGLRDSMSVSLFVLSWTDLLTTLVQLFMSLITPLYDVFLHQVRVDIMSFKILHLKWGRDIIYQVSCMIVAYISVERCFCVISPFKVGLVFTRTRSCVSMAVIVAVYLILPVTYFRELSYLWIPKWMRRSNSMTSFENVSSSDLKFKVEGTPNSERLSQVYSLVFGIGISAMVQVVIAVCALWMGHALKQSSKVRGGFTPARTTDNTESKSKQASKQEAKLSAKERRLVKVILYLAIIQTASNIPRYMGMICATYIFSLPEDLYMATIVFEIFFVFSTVSCSINIIVYFNVNSSYRKCLLRVFGRKPSLPKK